MNERKYSPEFKYIPKTPTFNYKDIEELIKQGKIKCFLGHQKDNPLEPIETIKTLKKIKELYEENSHSFEYIWSDDLETTKMKIDGKEICDKCIEKSNKYEKKYKGNPFPKDLNDILTKLIDDKNVNDIRLKCEHSIIPKIKCDVCQKSFEKMKKCSRCKKAFYCSKKCQKSDWIKHKKFC